MDPFENLSIRVMNHAEKHNWSIIERVTEPEIENTLRLHNVTSFQEALKLIRDLK